MSGLPAASQRRYCANWSVVEDGIGTTVTVLPVSCSQGFISSCMIARSLPVEPETKLTLTAPAAEAQSTPSAAPMAAPARIDGRSSRMSLSSPKLQAVIRFAPDT